MENSEPIFPRTDLCQQLKENPPDKKITCHLPSPFVWEGFRIQIPYYQIEIQFLADFYSYLLEVNYDDPCTFVQQYRPDSIYLDSMVSYLRNENRLFRNLVLFYQYKGDRILNIYLRSDMTSVVDFLKDSRGSIRMNLSDSSRSLGYSGFSWTLKGYGLSPQQFVQDLDQLDQSSLSRKYEPWINQAARDLQTYILKAPTIDHEILTFRYIRDHDYLNLGEGQITRLKGFTSTSLNHTFITQLHDSASSEILDKMVFIITPGTPILPFVHLGAFTGENEILLPSGTQIIYQRTLTIKHDFLYFKEPIYEILNQEETQIRATKFDPDTGRLQDIPCQNSQTAKLVHIFRVVTDPWEIQAALNYKPLNYNLYGPCLEQVSAQTGVSVETIKRISEQYLFHQ